MSKPAFKVVFDNTKKILATLRYLSKDAVLVGIPQQEAPRQNGGQGPVPINNAALLFLNEFGSALQNIPARPVMSIGMKKAGPEIVAAFKAGAQKALSDGPSGLSLAYNRAGLAASQSIKKVINDQEGIEPPAEATIKARQARGFKGTKALIVTGQMRNAITYVVKGEI